MKAFRALGVSGFLLISGCVNTNTAILGNAPQRAPVPMDQVAIYRTAAQVPGKYEEVALLNSTGMSSWTSEAGMLRNMRFKAGELGANAVILDAISEPSSGAKIAAAVLGVGAERKGHAIAIYIVPDATKKP